MQKNRNQEEHLKHESEFLRVVEFAKNLVDGQEQPENTVVALKDLVGQTVGPYQLREVLGIGGMGIVYVAEQDHPVRRKVALKVIKPGMDSREVINRFESERRALALMEHPNIASVIDAGTTDSGLPYFVMELIKGVSLTEYCNQNCCRVVERLELFVQVCKAVQHAHQKGIIHRDLKPSNVLVTVHDGQPVPKVIDFGVAKAIDQTLSEGTVYTKVSQLIGTPLYMSPEQAGFSDLDIDTRTDVYSLGVVLYELLAGSTPFTKEEFNGQSLEKIRAVIRESDPPRPSDRISTLEAAAQSTIAQQRQIPNSRLANSMRGDLDWIVMKAMEKDRSRRYDTAASFADDISRFLNDEPVEARPPSRRYRLQKFVRKNRVLVSFASVVSLILLAGISVSSWFAWSAAIAQKQESLARREVTVQRDSANRRLDLAIDAIRSYYTGIAGDMILNNEEHRELRKRLLQKPGEFFADLAQQLQSDTSPKGRYNLALANMDLFGIQSNCGRKKDALASLSNCIEILEELVQEQPANTQILSKLVLAHCDRYRLNMPDVHTKAGKPNPDDVPAAVVEGYHQTQNTWKLAERLINLKPDDQEAIKLGFRVASMASLASYNLDREVYAAFFESATSLLNKINLGGLDPAVSNDYYMIHAAAYFAFTVAQVDRQWLNDAVEILDRLIVRLEELISADSELKNVSDTLTQLIENRIDLHRSQNPDFDSLQDFIRILELRKNMLAQSPNSMSTKFSVARTEFSIAKRYFEREDFQLAYEYCDEATKAFQSIIAADSGRIHAVIMLQMCHQLRGDVLIGLKRYGEAVEAFESAGQIVNFHGDSRHNPIDVKIMLAKALNGDCPDLLEHAVDLSSKLKPIFSFDIAMSVAAYAEHDPENRAAYQNQAIQLLEHTFANSYSDQQNGIFTRELKNNPGFASIRELEQFQQMILNLEVKLDTAND